MSGGGVHTKEPRNTGSAGGPGQRAARGYDVRAVPRRSVVCGASTASARHGFRTLASPATAAMGRLGEEGPTGPRGGEPPLPYGSPAPPCRLPALLPGSGAPSTSDPSVTSAARSAPFASPAGRGGRAPSQCARAATSLAEARPSPQTPLPCRPPPHSSLLGECRRRRRRRRLPRLESACWRSAKEEGGGRARRLGLRRVRPRETRIVRPREGRPGWGRCTPRAEAEPGPRLAPAARRAHPAPRRGLQDEFPRVRVSWLVRRVRVCASEEAGRGREAGAGSGRSFGGSRERKGGPSWGSAGLAAQQGTRCPGCVRPRPTGPCRPGPGPAGDPGPLAAPRDVPASGPLFVPHPRVSGRAWGGCVGESRHQGRFLNP